MRNVKNPENTTNGANTSNSFNFESMPPEIANIEYITDRTKKNKINPNKNIIMSLFLLFILLKIS